MSNNAANATKQQQNKPYKFNKKIGATNYVVSVNFSQTSREDINDKILRLIKNDVQAKNNK